MVASIKDLMTKDVVTVNPETSLVAAVEIILKNDFAGLPVVDKNRVLLGIVTDYDLVLKGSAIHLPTFLKLLTEFQVYKKDASLIKGDIKKILAMKVADVMNTDPFYLYDTASVNEAIDAFGAHHGVNPIPIVNQEKRVVGILSRFDMLKLYSPTATPAREPKTKRDTDVSVNKFLQDFERQFVLVSKSRTRYWLAYGLVLALLGFIIAFAIILRIEF